MLFQGKKHERVSTSGLSRRHEEEASMNRESGFIHVYLLDGQGGGRRLEREELGSWEPAHGLLWVHLNYAAPDAALWLDEKSGLHEVAVRGLQQEDTRPGSATFPDGLLVFLRGVNMNPGSDPEDMVSLRLWFDGTRIISSRRRRVLSIADMASDVDRGEGPGTSAEFLVMVSDRLVTRMGAVVESVDDRVNELEERVLHAESRELRPMLSDIRRQIIALRRYLAPQREAMARLQVEKVSWLTDGDRLHLRETTDRIARYVEDLDSARDRAAVTHEELVSRLSEQTERRMYILSIVAAIFLPLGFVTGLLGINVGGIPGSENEWAFTEVVILLGVAAALQLLVMKRKKWL